MGAIRKLRSAILKQVTVPGGSAWVCSTCGRELRGGESVAKAGKLVMCSECIRKGR